MGSSTAANTEMTVRYSPAVENAYQQLIWFTYENNLVNNAMEAEPNIFPLTDFAGAFCDLYYNYFRPRVLDIGDVRDHLIGTQEDLVDSSVIDNQVAAHYQYLEDNINQVVLPKIRAGMRDIGAVMSSSFIDAQALVEVNKLKAVSKFSADLKLKMLEIAQDTWIKWMEWNWKVVNYQVNVLDLYYKVGSNYTKLWNDVAVGNELFPFTVLDQVRAIVGALNGAQAARSGKETMAMSGIQTTAAYVGVAANVASIAGSISKASEAAPA